MLRTQGPKILEEGNMDRTNEQTISVTCGNCGEICKFIKLETPISVSTWDKMNNFKRNHLFVCCQRSWLMDLEGQSIDCGNVLFNC